METKCQEHFSLNVNASGDVIIAMRNIAHPYFGSYLVSIYRGPDDNIDTLWITVYKKGKLRTFTVNQQLLASGTVNIVK